MSILSKIRKSLQLVGGATVKGLPWATESDHAVPRIQLDSVAATKQDNMSGGAGIDLTGSTVKVDLAVTGTDYGALTLSGSNYSSLDGEYQLAPFKGSLSYSGTSLDLDVGGDYNVYIKDNGGGIWAVVAKRDTDNIHNNGSTGESNGSWIAVLTAVDPTSISADYNNFIPNYQAVDYDFLTASSEQDDNGNGTVSSSAAGVSYASGNTPAGLVFENNKLAIDFASNVADAESTNVLPGSTTVTAINEAKAYASQAQNTSFSNAVAQLAGNPAKVQSAIEAAKALLDSVSNTVSNNQATASTEYGHIDDLQAALGSALADMGSTHATLSDNVTAKALLNELAVLIAALRADATATLGLATGGVINSAGDNVTDATDVATAISDLDIALGLVQGDLTSRIPAVDQYHNATQYPLTADQLAGIEPLNEVKYDQVDIQSGNAITWTTDMSGFAMDVRILVDFGSTGNVDAGIYDRDHNTGLLTRASYFNEATEIQKNSIFQIRYGGAIAGAEFMVVTPDEPVIGADPIGFENISAVIIGQGTLAKDRLRPELQAEFEALPRTFESAVLTIPANDYIEVVHPLKARCPYTIYDTAGNNLTGSFEEDATVDGVLRIESEDDSAVDVVVTMVGPRY